MVIRPVVVSNKPLKIKPNQIRVASQITNNIPGPKFVKKKTTARPTGRVQFRTEKKSKTTRKTENSQESTSLSVQQVSKDSSINSRETDENVQKVIFQDYE